MTPSQRGSDRAGRVLRGRCLLVLLAALGCRGASTPTEPNAPAPVADVPGPRRDGVGALAPVPGDTAVDRLIARSQAAVRANPHNPQGLHALARAFVRKARESGDPGFYEQARDATDRAIERDANDLEAHQIRAFVLLQGHRFAEVRSAAEALVARAPRMAMPYGLLGDAHMELGDYPAAERAYQRMVDLRPSLASYARVSWMRFLLGDLAGAIEAGEQAAGAGSARNPEETAWALTQLGGLHLNADALDPADAAYRSALAAFPNYPAAVFGRARVLEARGDLAGALTLYTQAATASELAEHLVAQGECLAALGRQAEATEVFGRFVRLARRSDRRALALWFATHDRDHADAVALARRELTERPGEVYTQDALAFALWRAGQLDEAQAMITRALRLGTLEPRFHYHAGRIALSRGDREAARRSLSDAWRIHPRFERHASAEMRRLLPTLGLDPDRLLLPDAGEPSPAGAR